LITSRANGRTQILWREAWKRWEVLMFRFKFRRPECKSLFFFIHFKLYLSANDCGVVSTGEFSGNRLKQSRQDLIVITLDPEFRAMQEDINTALATLDFSSDKLLLFSALKVIFFIIRRIAVGVVRMVQTLLRSSLTFIRCPRKAFICCSSSSSSCWSVEF